MEISYRNEEHDLNLAFKTLSWFDRLLLHGIDLWICIAIGMLPGVAWLIWHESLVGLLLCGGTAALLIGIFLVLIRRTQRKALELLPEQTIRLEPGWLEVQSTTSWSRRPWGAIKCVAASPDGILIGLDSWLWHVVPMRAFPSQEEANRFADMATRYLDEAQKNPPPQVALTLPPWFQVPPTLVQVSFQPTKKELLRPMLHAKAEQTQTGQTPQTPSRSSIWGLWVLVFVTMSLLLMLAPSEPFTLGILAFGSCIAIWVLGFIFIHRLRAHLSIRMHQLLPEVMTLTISGCILQSDERLSFLHWKDVLSIVHDELLVIFKLQGNMFHVVPKRAFRSTDEAEQFYQWCQEYWSAMQTDSAVPVAVPALLVDTGNPYQSPRQM